MEKEWKIILSVFLLVSIIGIFYVGYVESNKLDSEYYLYYFGSWALIIYLWFEVGCLMDKETVEDVKWDEMGYFDFIYQNIIFAIVSCAVAFITGMIGYVTYEMYTWITGTDWSGLMGFFDHIFRGLIQLAKMLFSDLIELLIMLIPTIKWVVGVMAIKWIIYKIWVKRRQNKEVIQ